MKDRIIELLNSDNFDDKVLGVTMAMKQRLGKNWIESQLNKISFFKKNVETTMILNKSYGVILGSYIKTVVDIRYKKTKWINNTKWKVIKLYE